MSALPSPPRPALRAASIKVAIAVIGAAVLVWRASRYWPFIADDALISLRCARRLVDGHGRERDQRPGDRGRAEPLAALIPLRPGACLGAHDRAPWALTGPGWSAVRRVKRAPTHGEPP